MAEQGANQGLELDLQGSGSVKIPVQRRIRHGLGQLRIEVGENGYHPNTADGQNRYRQVVVSAPNREIHRTFPADGQNFAQVGA